VKFKNNIIFIKCCYFNADYAHSQLRGGGFEVGLAQQNI
jgi:hypothetical protein